MWLKIKTNKTSKWWVGGCIKINEKEATYENREKESKKGEKTVIEM